MNALHLHSGHVADALLQSDPHFIFSPYSYFKYNILSLRICGSPSYSTSFIYSVSIVIEGENKQTARWGLLSPPHVSGLFLHCLLLPTLTVYPPPMTSPLPPITPDLFVLRGSGRYLVEIGRGLFPGNEVSGSPSTHRVHLTISLCPDTLGGPSGGPDGAFRRGERHWRRHTAVLDCWLSGFPDRRVVACL